MVLSTNDGSFGPENDPVQSQADQGHREATVQLSFPCPSISLALHGYVGNVGSFDVETWAKFTATVLKTYMYTDMLEALKEELQQC